MTLMGRWRGNVLVEGRYRVSLDIVANFNFSDPAVRNAIIPHIIDSMDKLREPSKSADLIIKGMSLMIRLSSNRRMDTRLQLEYQIKFCPECLSTIRPLIGHIDADCKLGIVDDVIST